MGLRRVVQPLLLVMVLALLGAGCASSRSGLPASSSDVGPVVEKIAASSDSQGDPAPVFPAGRFDNGKMWTFDAAPVDYFADEYGFAPDEGWFESARLGALRIPSCSASFVSPHGLLMTNHHCARESVVQVSRPGEGLLENGFYAESLAEERPIADFYADQLILITDVTAKIEERLGGLSGAERSEALRQAQDTLRAEMLADLGGDEAGYEVEIISLYNGARYSAYTFRRYDDVRLVLAPELSIGYFGGDPDNFTYPRYNLDVSFMRVYVDGAPYETPHYFPWSRSGAAADEPVFVIGNPGSTSRLQTVAELEFRRDHQDRAFLSWMKSRLAIVRAYIAEYPEQAEEYDLTNMVFEIENNVKSSEGTLKGLEDPQLLGRRRDGEQRFIQSFATDSVQQSEIRGLLGEMADLQQRSVELLPQLMSFFVNPEISWISSVLHRSVLGFLYAYQRQLGVPKEDLADLRESIAKIKNMPAELEKRLLAARLEDMVRHLGPDHPAPDGILAGREPAAAAADIVDGTAAVDSARFAGLLDDFMQSDDLASELGRAMAIGYINYVQSVDPVSARESEIAAALGRARYEVYGTELPPDATFSLRIADGRVKGYAYNGTIAPSFTTFYGLYDRFYSHGGEPWDLPERWQTPAPEFDLSTPLNLVSTNDIIGGNSGSPVINRDLEVVGLIFDGNIEGLPGDFIYTDDAGRAVAVDSRGILEAVDDIYGADRLVLELRNLAFVESEAEADEQMAE